MPENNVFLLKNALPTNPDTSYWAGFRPDIVRSYNYMDSPPDGYIPHCDQSFHPGRNILKQV